MKHCPFKQAHYLLSTLQDVPLFRSKNGAILPEIALAGRSNVGKSSLLNHLLHRKKLAKVSAEPGKTYTINYFNVDDQLIIVDLPGFGYAKRPDEIKALWSTAIDHYLEKRDSLALVLLLIDSRRLPTEEDIALARWAFHHRKPLLLIFTKSDTIKDSDRAKNLEKTLESIPTKNVMHYSIKDPKSRQHLIATVNQLLYG